jgi:hypothetical protein
MRTAEVDPHEQFDADDDNQRRTAGLHLEGHATSLSLNAADAETLESLAETDMNTRTERASSSSRSTSKGRLPTARDTHDPD